MFVNRLTIDYECYLWNQFQSINCLLLVKTVFPDVPPFSYCNPGQYNDMLPIDKLIFGIHKKSSRQERNHVYITDQASVLFKLEDRKSTRLNSSHVATSYAVFCLKKKKIQITV